MEPTEDKKTPPRCWEGKEQDVKRRGGQLLGPDTHVVDVFFSLFQKKKNKK